MGRELVSRAATHAEDIALAVGAALLAAGLGWRLGWWAALVTIGALAIAYGLFITPKGGAEWASPPPEEE